MRLIFAMPVLAAFALAACGDDTDAALTDEDLALAEATGSEAVGEFLPSPGEYRTQQELVELTLAGVAGAELQPLRAAFAEGAAEETHTYCVTAEMSRRQWLSDMLESECTPSRFEVEGGNLDATMSCTAAEGLNGRVGLTGTATEIASDMVVNFEQPLPGMGDAAIRMRVKSERIGDCA